MYQDFRSPKLQEVLAPLLDYYYGQTNWIYCGILEANYAILSKNTHRFRIRNQSPEIIEHHLYTNNINHNNHNSQIAQISSDLSHQITSNFQNTKWYHNFGSDVVNNPYSLNNNTRDLYIDICFSNLANFDNQIINVNNQTIYNNQSTDMLVDEELTNLFDQFNLHFL